MTDDKKMTEKELNKWYNQNADFVDPVLDQVNKSWDMLNYEEKLRFYGK